MIGYQNNNYVNCHQVTPPIPYVRCLREGFNGAEIHSPGSFTLNEAIMFWEYILKLNVFNKNVFLLFLVLMESVFAETMLEHILALIS